MTEKKAIELLQKNMNDIIFIGEYYDAMEMAVSALEEIQQYRAIGTVEECRDAVEKQKPKKPMFYDTKFRQRGKAYGENVTLERAYNCPCCNLTVWELDRTDYCEHCGQKLDWGEDEAPDSR